MTDLNNQNIFKTQLCFERSKFWCAQIKIVAQSYVEKCIEMGKTPLFTETVTTKKEDDEVNRLHDQHRRCVAFDASVKNWTEKEIQEMIDFLNTKHINIAYVTSSGKKQIAFCHDNGHGNHFHCSIHASYKKEEFKG